MRRAWVMGLLLAVGTFSSAATAADPNNPTGTQGLIAIAKRGAKIQFFDPLSHRLLTSLSVDENPHEVAIAPDHKTAYVSIYGPGIYGENPHPNHKIMIVDLSTHQITGTIDVSPYLGPHGLQVDAAGRLYATCETARKLLVIDPASRQVVDTIDTEGSAHWFTLLPDGSKAYFSAKDDKTYIAVIDMKSKKIIARIPAPNGTEGIAASPDGRHVAVSEHFKPGLMLIDTTTDRVIQHAAMQGYPLSQPGLNHQIRVRYSPDGRYLLTSYYPSALVSVVDPNDIARQTLIAVPKGPMGFAFSADGKTALVGSQDWGTVSVIALGATPHYVEDFDSQGGIETLAFY